MASADRLVWDTTTVLEALGAADVALWVWEPDRDRLRLSGASRALGLGPLAPEAASAAVRALVLPQDRAAVEDILRVREPGSEIAARLRMRGAEPCLWRGVWLEEGLRAAGVVAREMRFTASERDALTGLLDRRSFILRAREMLTAPGGFELAVADLNRLRQLCNETGTLLIYDEIQCGLGRTGKLFAYEWASDAAPDIVCLAKALGDGFPVGACVASAKAAKGMTVGSHGSTYGGNPLAMAVGLASLEELTKPETLANVREITGYFAQQLSGLKDRFPEVIDDIRGKGLLIGLKLKTPNREFMALARDQKLLIAGGGDNCVRLLPSLLLTREEAREAVEKLERACEAARAAAPAAA